MRCENFKDFYNTREGTLSNHFQGKTEENWDAKFLEDHFDPRVDLVVADTGHFAGLTTTTQ